MLYCRGNFVTYHSDIVVDNHSMFGDDIDMPTLAESSGGYVLARSEMAFYRNRKVKCNEMLTFFMVFQDGRSVETCINNHIFTSES